MIDFKLKALGGCKPKPAEERFDASYMPEPMSGCWLWLGRERGSNGYGSIKVAGKHLQAHRYSYERFVGQIPNGLFVLHRCDNPACVNPNHLFIGTHQDNQDDKVKKGRQARGVSLGMAQRKNKKRGQDSPISKLTWDQVNEIRDSSEAVRVLAERFNVSTTTINNIIARRTWK